jgi:hypothetical protein
VFDQLVVAKHTHVRLGVADVDGEEHAPIIPGRPAMTRFRGFPYRGWRFLGSSQPIKPNPTLQDVSTGAPIA